ncbi:UDP-N-acetylmuramyl pentapeptide phosphotransferase/UDP-N-acetylglucosamine-1-phosphate transferase [Parapedobacter composti]|uniref:UDP-N-acetylmuramyl pentapeptide phosphotransferase/UDP-N-acetylglucosamine-1-phosphate transferase n=1 Tax=Parapedobacter composti TaxID=623281 RepID=A0A1I1IS90_9SPHI|nr:glycosyltransferase family 4 protein [Parapedobacter composti]SFC39086.1 UDP-N-acetylmuramyl pentapeptide phosphotransferase/UDP-N-acetylglucosamine-1-phosphate transferase [Parapedobacter composti]
MLLPYIVIAVLLVAAMFLYFRIADRYNIIDKPNQRSSHTIITIRGGGVVFYLGALAWFCWSGFAYPWFFAGLTAITVISFLDDVFTLSNRLRLTVHLVSVLLMVYQLGAFELPWYVLPAALIIIIGTINAYNFMDGINGITVSYSFAVLLSLWLANRQWGFIDDRLLYCTAIANGVFAFFNFRQRAKCFAGDVGSVSMCFILLFATLSLIFASGNVIFILFFAVYGVDSVLTIVHRLLKRENIFEAHRSHLYQYLANEARVNRLGVSAAYGVLQVLIGWMVVRLADAPVATQLWFAAGILGGLGLVYVVVKRYLIRKFVR